MDLLTGVLGCRTLQRTFQVRLGSNTLWLPGGTPIFMVSLHQFMRHPGYYKEPLLVTILPHGVKKFLRVSRSLRGRGSLLSNIRKMRFFVK